jgi:peptide/nickel transport system permease protein
VRYVGEKTVQLVIVIFAVTVLTFLSIRALPGDPAIFIAGPGANEEQLDEIRAEKGLDRPIPVQYVTWVGDLATGDLGLSYGFNVPVSDLLKQRLPVSLWTMFWAMFLALAVSIPLGVFMAYRADSGFDRAANSVAFGLLSVPNFIMGLVLVYFMAVRWGDGSRRPVGTWPRGRARGVTSRPTSSRH